MSAVLNTLHWLCIFPLAVLAGGCASFSPYAVSAGELERHLRNAVRDYDRKQLQSASSLSLSLTDADITLGPSGRDVAIIGSKGQIALTVLMAKLPVDIRVAPGRLEFVMAD
jgi:hypothetical protein